MILKNIGPFKLHTKRPNNIKYGYLYEAEMETPLPIEPKRMVRVFVPNDYFQNENKRYAVMYMADGQNLVDKYLSAYGEWNIDEHNHTLMKEGYDGLIYVGLDCPKNSGARGAEMTPSIAKVERRQIKGMDKLERCGELYLDYFFDTLKPIIDKNFRTLKDRDHTYFGGSSMGGLITFYAAFYKAPYIKGALAFSPALFLMNKPNLRIFLNDVIKLNPEYKVNIAMLVGGKDFEHLFIESTYTAYKYLLRHGYKQNEVTLVMDTKEIHHENFWSKHFVDAMHFLLSK